MAYLPQLTGTESPPPMGPTIQR